MNRIFATIILFSTLVVFAAAPPHGVERLRDLVVVPEMELNFDFGIKSHGDEWIIDEDVDLQDQIARLRGELKGQPENINRLLQLGLLLDSHGETNESRACYQKAEQLCRSRIEAGSQDGLIFANLGEALWQLDKYEQAEITYRKAVLISSNDWRCWVRCGNFLASEPFQLIFPKNLRSQMTPAPQPPPPTLWDYRPSPESLKKAEMVRDEASHCFDRALALAPKESDLYIQRAGYLILSNWQNCFFQHFRNDTSIDPASWFSAFCSKGPISNLEKAAELNPRACTVTSLAAYFEWLQAVGQANWPSNITVDMLPGESRQSILKAMTRLEKLSEDFDSKTAAGALENLGFLHMMFNNRQQATADFRRSISLDSTREQSWDLLLATLLNSTSPEELVSACQARLKSKNSARNHILLTKAYIKQKAWDKAAEQARIAGELETNSVISPMLLAAIALKQSAQTNYLFIAYQNLKRSETLLANLPDGNERVKRWREFVLDRAIFCALTGQLQEAKNELNMVFAYFPDDEQAREILEAIE